MCLQLCCFNRLDGTKVSGSSESRGDKSLFVQELLLSLLADENCQQPTDYKKLLTASTVPSNASVAAEPPAQQKQQQQVSASATTVQPKASVSKHSVVSKHSSGLVASAGAVGQSSSGASHGSRHVPQNHAHSQQQQQSQQQHRNGIAPTAGSSSSSSVAASAAAAGATSDHHVTSTTHHGLGRPSLHPPTSQVQQQQPVQSEGRLAALHQPTGTRTAGAASVKRKSVPPAASARAGKEATSVGASKRH